MSDAAPSSMSIAPVTGLVLAGGLGRRMDGRDKGLLPLGQRALVAHVLERFAPQVSELIVNANRNPEIYAAFGHPVVADVITGHAGPLAGLHAGLCACTTPLLATVPCDAPRLPGDLVARLKAALVHANASLATASTGDRLQPAFLLCRCDVLPQLEAYLAGGGRSIHAWLDTMTTVKVHFDDISAFANINTPEELARLEA